MATALVAAVAATTLVVGPGAVPADASTHTCGLVDTTHLVDWRAMGVPDSTDPGSPFVATNVGGSDVDVTITSTAPSDDTNYLDDPDTVRVAPYNPYHEDPVVTNDGELLRWFLDPVVPSSAPTQQIESVVVTFSEPVLIDELFFGGVQDNGGRSATTLTAFAGPDATGAVVLPDGIVADSTATFTSPGTIDQTAALNVMADATGSVIAGFDSTGADAGSYVLIGDDTTGGLPWAIVNYEDAMVQSIRWEHLGTSSTDPNDARDNLSEALSYNAWLGKLDFSTLVECDFGDLPAPYPTDHASGGADHVIDGVTFLGAGVDGEDDGQPSTNADGDDTAADDEDGVTIPSLVPCTDAVITVTAAAPGYLSAFVDVDGDGTLDPVTLVSATGPAAVAPGAISDTHLSVAGTYQLTIDVPCSAVPGDTYSRWRFTAAAGQGGANVTGEAASGEVEDHMVTISAPTTYDLALRKTLAAGQSAVVTPGETVTYTIEVFNQGAVDANAFTIVDTYPAGWSLAADAVGWVDNGDGSASHAFAGTLTPGSSTTVDVRLVVPAGAAGDMVNHAEIDTDDGDDVDSTPDAVTDDPLVDDVIDNSGGDEDDHDVAVVTVSDFDLALVKTLAAGQAATVTPGSTVEFAITVVNQGGTDATDVRITDYLPASLSLSDQGWTDLGDGRVVTNSGIDIPAGSSATVTLRTVVDAAAATGVTITNWAEISSAAGPGGAVVVDVDSVPNQTNFSEAGETDDLTDDDVVDQDGRNGGDEDDHDPAVITVAAPSTPQINPPSQTPLPNTGSNTGIVLAMAAALLSGGLWLLWTSRKRLDMVAIRQRIGRH